MIRLKNDKKTVAVAMSGGVDSSVSAIILKEKGYNVIGLSMHLLGLSPVNAEDNGTCCSMSDIIDAKRVCVRLGIPHFVINFEDEFKKNVIDSFTEEYLKGRTPNPCIACNKIMKFDILLKRATELGAGYFATGHYARITHNKNGQYFLLEAKDKSKDQSYVLYNLTQYTLKRIIFPVGSFYKKDIRKIAMDYGYGELSKKKDSVEICFTGSGNYHEFLSSRINGRLPEINRGHIKNTKDEIIGKHDGIFHYTVGQRKRLGISSKTPLYVTKINADTNDIYVGSLTECYGSKFYIKDFNIIAGEHIALLPKMDLSVKIRYSSPKYKCSAAVKNDKINVKFNKPAKFITPGQSAVLYSGMKVIGGGIIDEKL